MFRMHRIKTERGTMTMKKGIDISYCQKGFDLARAKSEGVEYVIIRAGISTRTDTEFEAHTGKAIKVGLPYGFYWYSRAFSTEDARNEAIACLNAIKPYSPTYPIYYDMEEKDQIDRLNKATRTAIITTFCDTVRKAGYTAGVYLNPSWMETYVDKTQIVGKYEIWLANWTNDPNKPGKYDYGQKMHQWGLGTVCGAEVDADVCYVDYNLKQPAINPAPAAAGSNVIYKSYGIAGKRKKADINSEMPCRCEKDGYYAASQLVTPAAGAQQWFRHVDTGLYSLLVDTDGRKLFEQYGTYTAGKTNAFAKVKPSPEANAIETALLGPEHNVYLTGETKQADGLTWAQIVYGGQLAWMDKNLIKI